MTNFDGCLQYLSCWQRPWSLHRRRHRPRPYATARDVQQRRSSEGTAQLDKVERASGVPIMIETIDAIPGLDDNASAQPRRTAIDALAIERDKEIRDEGIYILISKRDHVISHVLVRERLADVLPIGKRDAIQEAFVEEFRKNEGEFDAGLIDGVQAIEHLWRVLGRTRARWPGAPRGCSTAERTAEG